MISLTRLLALAAVSLLAASASAQQAGPPSALAQAVAATQAAKAAYVFDLDIDSAEQNWRARFDPSATPNLRLLEPRREDLENDDRRAFDNIAERMEGVSWCASDNIDRVANVRLLREDAETATYAFQPTRESIRGEQARAYANRLRGELTLTKVNPDITHVRIFTPAAFSPMPLVRVDRLNIAITCAAAPNGRRFAAETVSEVRGSAFGQAFDERTVQRTRNVRPAS
jgi:hypothetical protein